jgi:hypothetical protein
MPDLKSKKRGISVNTRRLYMKTRKRSKKEFMLYLAIMAVLIFSGCGSADTDGDTDYVLRGTGPAGGIICYINPNAVGDGWGYLEVWVEDEAGHFFWKNAITSTPGTLQAIGTGYENTYSAMAGDEHPAAKAARDATHGGRTDWFLPSWDELTLIYNNLKMAGIGGFSNSNYWSSTEREGDERKARLRHFGDGSEPDDVSKNSEHIVRVIRRF